MSDIVERLLDWSEHDEGKINDTREEAAAEITRLTAENERLRAALLKADCYLALGSPTLALQTTTAALSPPQEPYT